MGVAKILSGSSYDGLYKTVLCFNPDPRNYVIKFYRKIGDFLAVLINYPDCKNYEGNKVLVFENIDLMDLQKQGTIDPHFSNSKRYHTPIARFEPTKRGWEMARTFCFALKERDGV